MVKFFLSYRMGVDGPQETKQTPTSNFCLRFQIFCHVPYTTLHFLWLDYRQIGLTGMLEEAPLTSRIGPKFTLEIIMQMSLNDY